MNDRTASNGQARVVYTAGNNLFPDVVRVTTRVGATASITITKTGTTTRGPVVALSASPTSVAPLGFSTITATVTDSGLAVQGERVTFTLTTNNGASLSVQSGLTNAGGQVTTVYQAGNNNVQDVIQAVLSNGATAQVIITKTGVGRRRNRSIAVGLPVAPLSIAVSASPASLSAGQVSIVTATVTDDDNAGVSGDGSRLPRPPPTGRSSATTAATDGSGVASVIYYAWNNLDAGSSAATDRAAVGYSQLVDHEDRAVSLGFTATMTAIRRH